MPKKKTLGEQMNEIADEKSEAALKNIYEWHKSCLWHMKVASQTRSRKAEVDVHSEEKARYAGSFESFEQQFTKAAEALKLRIEKDGSVKAHFQFKETTAKTLESGPEKREYPAAYVLTFKLHW